MTLFIVGLFAGVAVGIFLAALLTANKHNEYDLPPLPKSEEDKEDKNQ